jgi:16S rRNA (cytosine1402-N4)-methyltransferase
MPLMEAENLHKSVLLDETVEMLAPAAGETFVDCTLGLGGHTEKILQMSDDTQVIGIDQDPEAIRLATARLAPFGGRIKIFHANFAELKEVLKKAGVQKVNGVLADLGVSSMQFDDAKRGFSFRFDAPLDMRMDPDQAFETAAELLERLPEEEIADLIYKYGEERMSRRIARRIVWKRELGEAVKTTRELAETKKRSAAENRKTRSTRRRARFRPCGSRSTAKSKFSKILSATRSMF